MSTKPLALVVWAPGTNCHEDMADAFELAGAEANIVTLQELATSKTRLSDAQLIGLPGGFSFGDHFGSGRLLAFELAIRLRDQLLEAIRKQIPMIGICNGYQALTAMGLLPGGGSVERPTMALDFNLSARFEHWHDVDVYLYALKNRCVWTNGLDGTVISIPTAHGEGRQVTDKEVNIIATYGSYAGTADYPASPSGSHIAGTCDPTGLVMGMMPHPERRVDDIHGGSGGLLIFQAGVNSLA